LPQDVNVGATVLLDSEPTEVRRMNEVIELKEPKAKMLRSAAVLAQELENSVVGQFQTRDFKNAGYGRTVIAIVPAVRFPVPVDVTDGVALTVAVPGTIPRTSPATDTVKIFVLDDSRMIELVCDGCTGFDVPSENVSVTVSWITSPTRMVAGPVTWAVTSRPYSRPHAVRLINTSATTSNIGSMPVRFGVPERLGMPHSGTNRKRFRGRGISNPLPHLHVATMAPDRRFKGHTNSRCK
jgi:hypothetical protein